MARARMRYRTDRNQPEIVEFFRKSGATVQHTHMVGDGFVDIVVGYMGLNMLIEIKDGEAIPSKRKLTEDEEDFFMKWGGMAMVVESIEDCRQVLRIMRENAEKLRSPA